MEQLGVELILARSPQAKALVERMNGVLQDQLVKALRLEKISELGRANEYLAQTFLPTLNRWFRREAASPADVHRGVPRKLAGPSDLHTELPVALGAMFLVFTPSVAIYGKQGAITATESAGGTAARRGGAA